MGFADRFTVKRAAGWSPQRRDGSSYSADCDTFAGEAEAWAALCCGAFVDVNVYLHGDPGWDFETQGLEGELLRVDVIHLGRGRAATGAHLIVNQGHPKLKQADVFVVVAGPPWVSVGAIHRERFLELCVPRDFGYGEKLSLPCDVLAPVGALLPFWEE